MVHITNEKDKEQMNTIDIHFFFFSFPSRLPLPIDVPSGQIQHDRISFFLHGTIRAVEVTYRAGEVKSSVEIKGPFFQWLCEERKSDCGKPKSVVLRMMAG